MKGKPIAFAGLAAAAVSGRFQVDPTPGPLSWWAGLLILALVVVAVWLVISWQARRSIDETRDWAATHPLHEEEPPVSFQAAAVPQSGGAVMEPAVEPLVPAAAVADDLTVIEGIGPRIALILHDAGINTFDELASAEVSRVEEILRSASLPFIDPGSWAEQARLAAAGDWAGLQALQDRLKAGR